MAARPISVAFAVCSLIAGAVGWFSSFMLLTEYVRTLQDPDRIPACSISKLVTCGPNMDAWQGSLFGFSNTIIGVAAFVAPIFVGVALLAGARFSRGFWWCYLLGLLGGIVFVTWLQAQSIFVLGTLCPWCMVVWAVMILLWWVTLARLAADGALRRSGSPSRAGAFVASWTWAAVLAHVVVIAVVAQARLDWLMEFRLAAL